MIPCNDPFNKIPFQNHRPKMRQNNGLKNSQLTEIFDQRFFNIFYDRKRELFVMYNFWTMR